MTSLETLVNLYKRAAETGDAGPVLAALADLPADTRLSLSDFLASERARLIKLRTLGLTARFEEKKAVTDSILKHLKEAP